jgi:hypothetical protein
VSITNFPVEGTVGTTLRPKRFDLEVYQGDTFTFNLVLKGNGGTPLDISGWTGIAQIKKADGSAGETPSLDLEIGGTDGIIQISLTGTETSALEPESGPYKYDVQLTDTAGNKRTFIGGTIVITEDISE